MSLRNALSSQFDPWIQDDQVSSIMDILNK